MPCEFPSFASLFLAALRLPAPCIRDSLTIDVGLPRQARAAAKSAASSSSGSRAARRAKPRQAGAADGTPAASPAGDDGASAKAADVPAGSTSALLAASAAGAGSPASSPSTAGTSSAGGSPACRRACRRRRCQTAAIAGGWLKSAFFSSIRVHYGRWCRISLFWLLGFDSSRQHNGRRPTLRALCRWLASATT